MNGAYGQIMRHVVIGTMGVGSVIGVIAGVIMTVAFPEPVNYLAAGGWVLLAGAYSWRQVREADRLEKQGGFVEAGDS